MIVRSPQLGCRFLYFWHRRPIQSCCPVGSHHCPGVGQVLVVSPCDRSRLCQHSDDKCSFITSSPSRSCSREVPRARLGELPAHFSMQLVAGRAKLMWGACFTPTSLLVHDVIPCHTPKSCDYDAEPVSLSFGSSGIGRSMQAPSPKKRAPWKCAQKGPPAEGSPMQYSISRGLKS
jgi:hypothetical protein